MIDPADERAEAGSGRGSVAGLAGASYFALLTGLVTSPLVARAVGPSGRGQIASATVYLILATTAIGMGIPVAIGHAVANRLHPLEAALSTAVRFCWLTVPVTAVLTAVVLAWPLRELSPSARAWTGALMMTAPVALLALCLAALLVARGDLRALARVQAFTPVCVGFGVIAGFILHSLTVSSYLAILVVTSLLTVAVSWRLVGARPTRPVPMRPLIKFGLRGYIGYFAVTGAVRVDQAFIGPMLGSRALGIYAVAVAVAILPFTLAQAVASRAFGTVAAAGPDERVDVVSRFLRLTVLASALVALAIGVVSPVAVPLMYGKAFSEVVGPLLILLPGVVALSASGTASACLTALSHPGQTTIAEICGFVVTLVGLPFVLPAFGIIGAAVLSSVTYTTTFVVYRSFLRRLGPVGFWPGIREAKWIASAVRHRGRIPGARVVPAPGLALEPPIRQGMSPIEEGDG